MESNRNRINVAFGEEREKSKRRDPTLFNADPIEEIKEEIEQAD